MTHSINKCSAQETAACCCVDVGTIIDNEDCTASFHMTFVQDKDAKSMLTKLTELARSVGSEPCIINSSIHDGDEGVELNADFTFEYQVETLIFQMKLREIPSYQALD